MTEIPAVVAEEVKLLTETRLVLSEHPVERQVSEAEIVAELLRLRDELPTAKEEDKGSLVTQYDQLMSVLDSLRDARDGGSVDPDSPYFAHLAIEENGKLRHVYLGKATRIDHGLRIVDWRNAPVSRIFYRYQEGDIYEEEIGGRQVEGEVLARRMVTVIQGELVRIESPAGVYRQTTTGWQHAPPGQLRLVGGQGTALRAQSGQDAGSRRLGTSEAGARHRVDKHLPDIAGLLDPAQFALITRPAAGFVVIRGAAGSGKTTVALHRVAWLAYQDPTLDSPRTMVLVFSRALREYVAHVLPALGIHRAQVRTYHDWVSGMRKRHFPKLPSIVREDPPSVVVRMKQHPAALVVLDAHIARNAAPGTPEQALDDWGSALTNRALWQETLESMDPHAFTAAELERALAACHQQVEALARLLEGEPDPDDGPALDPEDDALLLRAWQRRVGPLRDPNRQPLRYRHIALDEVQDFSPLEVRVLLDCLDEKQSITLAGDTQQHVMQESGFTSWLDFFRHLGLQGTSVDTLRIAYRSARPIVQLAQAVLGDLREEDGALKVTREGPEVELFRFTDHGATYAFLADTLKALLRAEPSASVALLTPDSATANLAAAALREAEVPNLRRVQNQAFTFTAGIDVVEISDAKGLEFDYVIVLDASAAHFPDQPAARRLLHVAVTRAVHQLWLTCVGEPSPLLPFDPS